jgi:hypothetical protein
MDGVGRRRAAPSTSFRPAAGNESKGRALLTQRRTLQTTGRGAAPLTLVVLMASAPLGTRPGRVMAGIVVAGS